MKLTKITCAHCGKQSFKSRGAVTRAQKIGAPLYCDKNCAGLARRNPNPLTDAEKRAAKSAYDAEYRLRDVDALKAKKKAYHERTYDPEKTRAYNQSRMAQHIEYCRRPAYRMQKREYDKEYRAKAEYGEFWECFLLSQSIHETAVEKAGGWYELALMKGTLNKAMQRRRDYDRLDREEPESSPLGNLDRTQRR